MNLESLRPTIVLVHGAFEDGSIWNKVIQRLQRAGYPVVAAANALQGVAVDAAYLRSLLDRIQGTVILVAHSYGGAVITQAGADAPNVKGLVYAAAIMPAAGEAAVQLIERFPGSSFPTSVEEVSYTLPDGASGTYLLYQADKVPQPGRRRCARERGRADARHSTPHELGRPDRDGDLRCMDQQAQLANRDSAGPRNSSGRAEVRSRPRTLPRHRG